MSGWNKDRVETREFRRLREYVRKRDMGLCVRCMVLFGRYQHARDCDHLIPVAQGGKDDIDNLWMLCGVDTESNCHWNKTHRESRGLQGFEKITSVTGWPVDGDSISDWQEEIKKRNLQWANGQKAI